MVAKPERNISSIEVRAADRDKYLVQELQNAQERNMAMQRGHAGNVSIAEAIQAQRLRETYTNEMAEVARTNQEFLLEELSKNFVKFRREEAFRFARTEDEKCRGLLLHLLVLADQLVQLFLCIDFLLHGCADAGRRLHLVLEEAAQLGQHTSGHPWVVELGRLAVRAHSRDVLQTQIANCTVAPSPVHVALWPHRDVLAHAGPLLVLHSGISRVGLEDPLVIQGCCLELGPSLSANVVRHVALGGHGHRENLERK